MITEKEIEKASKEMHTESEKKQKQIFEQRGYYGGYKIVSWEDTKEGFYKSHVRSLAEIKLKKKGKKNVKQAD